MRLYDLIRAKGRTPPFFGKDAIKPNPGVLERAVVITVDDVARYFFEGTDQEQWDAGLDFPNLAPPFETFFMESRAPDKIVSEEHGEMPWGARPAQWGVLFTGIEIPESDKPHMMEAFRPAKWVLTGLTYIKEANKQHPWGPVTVVHLFVKSDGSPIVKEDGTALFLSGISVKNNSKLSSSPIFGHLMGVSGAWVNPMYMAITFMHSKQSTLQPVEPIDKLSKKFNKKNGVPLTKYHILDVAPIRRILKEEGNDQEVGSKKALHVCRGHFKTFTPERPLMGKHVGTYWWPPMWRGRGQGKVNKDYNVKAE